MRAETVASWIVALGLVSVAVSAESESPESDAPDDEFLEFLGGWDEAWEQACAPDGYLPGDDEACNESDDEDEDDD